MTLEQVIANLEHTIQSKRDLLYDMQYYSSKGDTYMHGVSETFVEQNVAELERVLQDLRKVQMAQRAEQAALSWEKNPDRMGGCYTSEEIAESRGWR